MTRKSVLDEIRKKNEVYSIKVLDEEFEKSLKEFLITFCIEMAKKKRDCLFVIKKAELDYDCLQPQRGVPYNILDPKNRKKLEHDSTYPEWDGACIIDEEGNLIAYTAQILNVTKVYPGYGTKHSAAFFTSLSGNIAILISEQDRKVRVFEDGKMAEMNPEEKRLDVNKVVETLKIIPTLKRPQLKELLRSFLVGVVTITGVGVVSSIPAFAPLAPYIVLPTVPGVIYYTTIHAGIKNKKKHTRQIAGIIAAFVGLFFLLYPVINNNLHYLIGAVTILIGVFIAIKNRKSSKI